MLDKNGKGEGELRTKQGQNGKGKEEKENGRIRRKEKNGKDDDQQFITVTNHKITGNKPSKKFQSPE